MADVTGQIVINDFSLGIYADYLGGTSDTSRGFTLTKNGAAVIDGTYRCTSDHLGALIPLPRCNVNYALIPIPGTADSSHYPSSFIGTYVMDAVIPGSYAAAGYGTGSPERRTSIAALYHFFYDTAGAGTNYTSTWIGRLHNYFSGSAASIDFFYGRASTAVTAFKLLPPSSLTMARYAGTAGALVGSHIITGVCGSDSTGRNLGFKTGAIPGTETGLTTYDTDISGNYPNLTASNAAYFPGQATGSTPTQPLATAPTGASAGLQMPRMVMSHQGRLVGVLSLAYNYTTSSQYIFTDYLQYYATDDFVSAGASALAVWEENVYTVGTLISAAVDTLLVIKDSGGGVAIRGDLDNPTVVPLPFLESTHGVMVRPVMTPMGVVYGTKNGVFQWSGGQNATKLSPQLDGWFWNHTASNSEVYHGVSGRFGYWHPYVCVPNNFIFNTLTQSWWRLENPSNINGSGTGSYPYNIYLDDPSTQRLIAFQYKRLTGGDTTTSGCDYFDPARPSDNYTWRSQPLLESRDGTMSVHEIRLTASAQLNGSGGSSGGDATIVVTLTGYDDQGVALPAQSTTYTWTPTATGVPISIRQDIQNFNAMYVQVSVAASRANIVGFAPKIHNITIGTGERNRLPSR